jgi:hypothetical protein
MTLKVYRVIRAWRGQKIEFLAYEGAALQPSDKAEFSHWQTVLWEPGSFEIPVKAPFHVPTGPF